MSETRLDKCKEKYYLYTKIFIQGTITCLYYHNVLSLLVCPGVIFLVGALQHQVDVLRDVAPARGVAPLHLGLEGSHLHLLELLQGVEHLLGLFC